MFLTVFVFTVLDNFSVSFSEKVSRFGKTEIGCKYTKYPRKVQRYHY